MAVRVKKKDRQLLLKCKLEEYPFLTDEELSNELKVSIQTIRLDRLELGIPEVRERIKLLAEQTSDKLKTIHSSEMIGELVDLQVGINGISVLEVSPEMVFEKTKVARGHYIFAQANSLALAVIDAPAAVTGVANIKFKQPVYVGDKLIAKSEVIRKRRNKFFVWVITKVNNHEVFRGKFIIVSLDS